jgi:hypothetical protein
MLPGQPQEEYAPAEQEIPGLTKMFDLTAGKYDVTVSSGPSFTTRREESAQQMMEFIRVFPQAAPLIGDLLAKNLDWPGADEVAERLKAMLPPQAQGQGNQMVQQLQQAMQQQGQQAQQAVGELQQQLQQLQQQLADKQADLQLKAQELSIKDKQAETDRIKVVLEAQNREQEQRTRLIESANQSNAAMVAANRPEQSPGM